MGSSPLTRGKRHASVRFQVVAGLIPAHAGKTRGRCARSRTRPAHPRSRGENVGGGGGGWASVGSSPLTRGKRPHIRRFVGEERLIPAHAGKTCCGFCPGSGRPAHPRSRGENASTVAISPLLAGSSPLTRGKHPPPDGGLSPSRLIPAHAGKTMRSRCLRRGSGAHPRSRGENVSEGHGRCIAQGSSPLTRGKPDPDCHATVKCVAHPRSRGENIDGFVSGIKSAGSSPLTRGKPGQYSLECRQERLIPAHAGKT